jgi:hypothetical protein
VQGKARGKTRNVRRCLARLRTPAQPLLLTSEYEYGMFEHFRRYPWVLDTYYYDNLSEVLASIEDKVISPAETKARELSS